MSTTLSLTKRTSVWAFDRSAPGDVCAVRAGREEVAGAAAGPLRGRDESVVEPKELVVRDRSDHAAEPEDVEKPDVAFRHGWAYRCQSSAAMTS